MSDFVNSPAEPIATPPKGYRGSNGEYDGEKGYPGRTTSPNGVPEKVRDGGMPSVNKNEILADELPKNIK